jgi:hypothetical protein
MDWSGQLRQHAKFYDGLRSHIGIGLPTLAADLRDAADEIERLRSLLANSEMTVVEVMADNTRLRAENEHLRAALRKIADCERGGCLGSDADELIDTARDALTSASLQSTSAAPDCPGIPESTPSP